ncbi:alpha-amylase [Apiospora rasikravindrae]|uniref:Alpha-amylase n=1 Tax=Apiospora rasikravindrae TaxID=990691 RepID=A0ABR1TCY3_9PEZI
MKLSPTSLLLGAASVTQALSGAEWQKQSIYQILTDRFARTDGSTTEQCTITSYCGGTYKGLINHLDYIQGMGFTAVWISPIVKNLEGETPHGTAYHGYWAQDIYSLNENFGTEQDLIDLSAALHARGMYLMVDVVTNHMGYNGCGDCVDYSLLKPFDNSGYYHPFCEINYDDDNSVRTCWEGDNQVSLPDLKTEDSGIRDTFSDWIKDLVAKYSIDGMRIDSVKHVEKDFWPGFLEAAGIYGIGEVFDGNPAIYGDWQKYMQGLMNYPLFYWVQQTFSNPSATMDNLVNGINTMKGQVADTTALGVFIENHDQARFPSLTSDMSLAKNAIAFTLLSDGIPILYQGQEQHYSGGETPNQREALWTSGYNTQSELYQLVATLNQVRNHTLAARNAESGYVKYQAWSVYSDSHSIAMRKGNVIGVFSNLGSGGSGYQINISGGNSGYAGGEQVVQVLGGDCNVITADGAGALNVDVGPDPVVLYKASALEGSGLCGR